MADFDLDTTLREGGLLAQRLLLSGKSLDSESALLRSPALRASVLHTANVRRVFDNASSVECELMPAPHPSTSSTPLRCQIGDVLVGFVTSSSSSPFSVNVWNHGDHQDGQEGNQRRPVPPVVRSLEKLCLTEGDLLESEEKTDPSSCPPRALVVAAPIGQRESSTHVNGYVPSEGLDITLGRELAFLTKNGIVGLPVGNQGSSIHALAQTGQTFTVLGVVMTTSTTSQSGQQGEAQTTGTTIRRPLNLVDLAVPSELLPTSLKTNTRKIKPILCIAATSAEAGKTTLTCKIIHELTHTHKLRVAAIKATGTGGVSDSEEYRTLGGAEWTFDQVDSGLPSTYVSPDLYASRCQRSFDAAQNTTECDVIVVELGGDIVWANNRTLFLQPFFQQRLKRLWVIANDSLAALGVWQWLKGLPPSTLTPAAVADTTTTTDQHQFPLLAKLRLVASPFRNLTGERARARQTVEELWIDQPPPLPFGSSSSGESESEEAIKTKSLLRALASEALSSLCDPNSVGELLTGALLEEIRAC